MYNNMKDNMNKLKWKKTSKFFRGGYASYYAISPINDFVFITHDQGGQWSNHIIFKKHLNLINSISCDWLNVDDLKIKDTQQTIIDCACHTLKGSKHEFQKYVDNFSKIKKHGFDFYILKDYLNATTKERKKCN